MICDIVIADADVVYVVVDPLLFHCYYSKGVLFVLDLWVVAEADLDLVIGIFKGRPFCLQPLSCY